MGPKVPKGRLGRKIRMNPLKELRGSVLLAIFSSEVAGLSQLQGLSTSKLND
jgi:hypothetical protein